MKGNTHSPNALTNQAQILTTRRPQHKHGIQRVCAMTQWLRDQTGDQHTPQGWHTHTHTHTPQRGDTHSRIGDASCEHVQKCEERAVAVQSGVLGKRREGVMVVCTGGEEVVSWCGGGFGDCCCLNSYQMIPQRGK